MIQFESVSKTFRDGTTAVTDLSLTVPSHNFTVIVGPSGCGKTTTLRMVNRMVEPTKGRITWDGTPMKSFRKTTLRRQMGYVIQSGGLFPHRTVLENIGTVPSLLHWNANKIRKRSFELMASVGLDTKLAHRYPTQLSGGQQQRVGVARALAADPLVLLMDEPFSAVDPVVRTELQDFFLGLQRQLSKTIIFITHDIDEAIRLGDQVAILRVGGRLAQVGTPQQLLDQPADAFVEGFIGRDRGYRSLSFLPAADLPLGSVQVVRDPGSATDVNALVVDAEARPLGWADPSRPNGVQPVGATFDPETDTLRTALDGALTSTNGLAVAVHRASGGRYAGVVTAQEILSQAQQTRSAQPESISVSGEIEPASPEVGAMDAEQNSEESPSADQAAGDAEQNSEEPSSADQAAGDAAGYPPTRDVANDGELIPDEAPGDEPVGDAAPRDISHSVTGTNGHSHRPVEVRQWEPDQFDALEVERSEHREAEPSEAPVR